MSFINNLKIGRKLAAVFGVLVAIMILSGAMTAWQLENASGSSREVARVQKLVENLQAMHGRALAQAIEIRGLLLTGDRSSIDRFEENGKAFDIAAVRLLQAVGGDNQAAAIVRDYAAVNRAWRETAERQIALMRQPLTVDEARVIEANGAGTDYVEALRTRFERLSAFAEETSAIAHASQATAFTLVRVLAAISAVLGIVVAIVGYVLLTSGIAKPINAMTQTMGEMANGNHDVTVLGTQRGDEVGQMAEAVEVFRRNMIETERLQAEAAAKQRAELDRAQKLRDVTHSFETDAQSMTEQVASAATELEQTAQSLSGIADQSTERATMVAAASEQTSANVQTVATASTQLSSSISEISQQVGNANKIARSAREEAESTQSEVEALADAAQKIGAVVNLIQEIAEQTNLLALNATIESARAGEAGKGFAVVASEVKNLAGQTGKATEEIGAQIQAVQDRTQSAVRAIAKIVDRVNAVEEVASSVAAAVEEQDSATNEISRNVSEVASAAEDVNTNIASLREAAGQTGDSSGEVLSTAQQLSKQAEQLKARVGQFLKDVQAA